MSTDIETRLETLEKDIKLLQDYMKSLLQTNSSISTEIASVNDYSYILLSDITLDFRGVITFIPTHFSKTPSAMSPCTNLIIRHSDGTSDTYILVVVNSQGLRRNVREGDIIANRPCQIMLMPQGYALVLNPASVFLCKPEHIDSVFSGDKQSESLAKDIQRLDASISNIKEELMKAIPKIIIGTGDPIDVLKDSDDNTVYFKVEETV